MIKIFYQTTDYLVEHPYSYYQEVVKIDNGKWVNDIHLLFRHKFNENVRVFSIDYDNEMIDIHFKYRVRSKRGLLCLEGTTLSVKVKVCKRNPIMRLRRTRANEKPVGTVVVEGAYLKFMETLK